MLEESPISEDLKEGEKKGLVPKRGPGNNVIF